MSYRDWVLSILALSSALIAATLLAGYVHWISLLPQPAQEKTRSGVAEGREAIERETDWEIYRQSGIPLNPGWPIVFEDKSVSASDCAEEKDCRSEQRDYSDLKAQWRAADAAQGQYFLAKWGTGIAAIGAIIAAAGTALLIWSLRQTRESIAIARKADRSWIGIELRTESIVPIEQETVDFALVNYGKFPAIVEMFEMLIDGTSVIEDGEIPTLIAPEKPTQTFKIRIPEIGFDDDDFPMPTDCGTKLRRVVVPVVYGNKMFVITMRTIYRDATGGPQRETKFTWMCDFGNLIRHGGADQNYMK